MLHPEWQEYDGWGHIAQPKELSCFHRFNDEDRIIVPKDPIGEKSKFVQDASHFR